MKPNILKTANLLFAHKPPGVSTHSPEIGRFGFKEYLEQILDIPLYTSHRLDKETSGAIVFALTREKATELTELFTQKRVSKRYLFISDRKIQKDEFSISASIEKKGSTYSVSNAGVPAETSFRRLKNLNSFSLWEARPRTGRTHQIRIHAAHAGVPIFGCSKYGGSPSSHLLLHAEEISGEGFSHRSPLPQVFEDLSLLLSPVLLAASYAFYRRSSLFITEEDECMRLLHYELHGITLDKLGSVGWWTCHDDEAFKNVKEIQKRFASQLPTKQTIIINKKSSKEKDTSEQSGIWQAKEEDVAFEFRSNQGDSSGLFLDQRLTRSLVRKNSQGKRVLNLFSYTSGFSVVSALGGAESVTSVDLSAPYLEWGKRNFLLNDLNPSDDIKFRFVKMDALEFVHYAKRKNLSYDLIIVDPPSFSRTRDGTFRIETDLVTLLSDCEALLSEHGDLIVSTNYEKWNFEMFREITMQALSRNYRQVEQILPDWDFELPGTEPRTKILFLRTR